MDLEEEEEETSQRMVRIRLEFDEPKSISDGTIPCSEPLKVLFSHILKLGKTRSRAYRQYIGADLLRKPWRGQIKSRAEFIARSAQQLNRGKGPENCKLPAILQSEIMARISVEVECEICRSRFWHSERSALPEALSIKHQKAIEALQAARPPCTCNAEASNVDDDYDESDSRDVGVMWLEDALDDDDEKQTDTQAKSIRAAEFLHQACCIHIPRKELLQSRIGFLTYDMPFLAITSDQGGNNNNRPTDSKLPSHRACQMLLPQEGLRQDAGQTTAWEAGPLSWQILVRGSMWSITACYFEGHDTDSCCVHIAPLWEGCIESVDRALQLLLIIDYIIDWGREIYRRAVVDSLFRASRLEAKPMIHSTRTMRRYNKSDSQSSTAPRTPKTSVSDPLRMHDNGSVFVRDARFVRSLFVGLYVTEDNYGTLMGSLTPNKRKSLAESILKCLTEAWRVSKGELEGLELSWTSTSREYADQYPKDKIFLVVVSLAAYLTTSWQPTRELGYLAIAETLLDRLLETASLQHHPGRTPAGFPKVGISGMGIFSLLKQGTIQDTLKACVARKCRQTGIEPMMCGKSENEKSPNFQFWYSEMTAEGIRHRLDVVVKPVSVSKARNIVFELLNEHMVEVSSSLIRVSSLLEELPRPGEAQEFPQPPSGDDCVWDLPSGLPDFEERNLVLATAAKSGKAGAATNEVCIFIIDSTVLEDGLPLATLLETCPDWHLRVKRFNRKQGWGARDGNLSDFVCRDRSIDPQVAEYRDYLRSTALGSVSLDDVASNGNQGFWAPKDYTRSMAIMTNPKEGFKFDFGDALRCAENMPRRRLSSMIWRNPPKNAKPENTISLELDPKGNPILPNKSGTSTTRREHGGPKRSSPQSIPVSPNTNTPQLQQSAHKTISIQGIQKGKTVIAVDAENEEAEASSSKGKRPLWDGLPEHGGAGSGPSSKRPRLSETHGQPGDALNDTEFDMLLESGAFD